MEANPKPTTLKEVFLKYTGGKPEIESKPYAKIYKDAGIIDKKFIANDADLNFSRCKSGKVKGLTLEQFEKTLELAAVKKGVTKEDLIQKIIATGGPKFAGTKADNVRLHDDKSTYTGVYARGGPTTVDAGRSGGNISDIAQICDRSKADVRGVKK